MNMTCEDAPQTGYRCQVMAIVTLIVFILGALPSIGMAETEQHFYLCSSLVETSAVGEQTALGWPVYIKLTAVGSRSFEAYTEANVGTILRIMVGSREFARATIRAPISTGSIQRAFESRDEALAWQVTLAGKLPEAPCGVRS